MFDLPQDLRYSMPMASRYTVAQWALLSESERALLLRRNPRIQSEIARDLDVGQSTVSRVWWGQTTSARILKAICARVKK